MIELPIVVRSGVPPDEPDFVATHDDTAIGLFEVTEATSEADQREMTGSSILAILPCCAASSAVGSRPGYRDRD
jgi:hypothetical protein